MLASELGEARPLVVEQEADKAGVREVGVDPPEQIDLRLQRGPLGKQALRLPHLLGIGIDGTLETFDTVRNNRDRCGDVAVDIEICEQPNAFLAERYESFVMRCQVTAELGGDR